MSGVGRAMLDLRHLFSSMRVWLRPLAAVLRMLFHGRASTVVL